MIFSTHKDNQETLGRDLAESNPAAGSENETVDVGSLHSGKPRQCLEKNKKTCTCRL